MTEPILLAVEFTVPAECTYNGPNGSYIENKVVRVRIRTFDSLARECSMLEEIQVME